MKILKPMLNIWQAARKPEMQQSRTKVLQVFTFLKLSPCFFHIQQKDPSKIRGLF